jgi:hypothetical protein
VSSIKGGAKLESALAEIARKVSRPASLNVGFLEGATYPDGTPVALVAAVQNFGSRTVPPRPFFDQMVADHKDEWPKVLGNLLMQTKYDPVKALNLLGFAMRGELQKSIILAPGPPLAAATIKRKGFDKELVDSGHMLNSADWEVKE